LGEVALKTGASFSAVNNFSGVERPPLIQGGVEEWTIFTFPIAHRAIWL
jgi:hypothetical protein